MKRYLAGLLAAVMLLSTMGTGALAEPVAETNVETIEAQASEAPAQATEEKIEEQPAEKKEQPAEQPTVEATKAPAEEPAEKPSAEPTVVPAEEPTEKPAEEPTEAPAVETTEEPSAEPTEQPSEETTAAPSEQPTEAPSEQATVAPSEEPTAAPSEEPTVEPSEAPADGQPRTAAELAEMLGFETVEALAEAMEMDVSELEALSAEEIAALYAQLTNPSLQAAALGASDFTVVDGVLLAYTGSDVDVVIPTDLGITVIDSGVFKGTMIQSVVIPEGVTEIQPNAFAGCYFLKSVTFPSTLKKIGTEAFRGCNRLASADIPDSVESIGKGAFWGCYALANVNLPEGLKTIQEKAFDGCSSLTEVRLPESLIDLESYAFMGCEKLKSVVIPGTITAIPKGAFQECYQLKKVSIGEGITEIGQDAFYNCLTMREITLPEGLMRIGIGAFSNCRQLQEITLPEGLTRIERSTFSGCSALTKVALPSSLEYIGMYAFRNDYVLLSIVIPENVRTMDDDIFQNCNGLTAVVYLDSVALTYCQTNGISYVVRVPQVIRSAKTEQTGIDAQDCAVVTFTVTTSKDAQSLKLCAESGAQVAVFTEKNAQVVASDDGLTWTFDYAFVNDGKRELSLIAATEDGDCKAWPITADMRGTRVKAASFPGAWAERGRAAQIRVTTNMGSDTLCMYSENGALICTWPAEGNSSVSGSDRIWSVTYAFANAGTRTMTFRALRSGMGGHTSASAQVKVELPVTVDSVSVSTATVTAKETLMFTVNTSTNAKYVRMYSEGGYLVKNWAADGNSTVSGSARIWTLSYAFGNAGDRTLTFRATADGIHFGEGKSASVKVMPVPDVTSASASTDTVTAKETLTFTVKTSANAKYVRMYSEGGYLVKSWAADGNSTVSGSARIWTLSYAFGNAGDRTLTFRASADGTHFGEGKSASVKVMPVPDVTSASASADTVTVGISLTFTAITPTNSRYLTLYAEGGARVKSWNCDGNSTVSGDVRTWTVAYAFGGTGNRRVTLKASADDVHCGSGKELAIKVLPVTDVTSASASAATVTAQETMTFTVRTPAGASVLALFSEGGSFVKRWSSDGNSTVSGNMRTWTVEYAFGGTGDRRVTLKASADGVNFGKGIELAVKVLPVPGVQSAKFSSSTVKRGAKVNVVVKASSNSRYLHMFIEDGTLYRTWSSEGNSVISGGTRVWTIPLSFSARGTRKITFRVSADNVHYGSAMTATIKVK